MIWMVRHTSCSKRLTAPLNPGFAAVLENEEVTQFQRIEGQ